MDSVSNHPPPHRTADRNKNRSMCYILCTADKTDHAISYHVRLPVGGVGMALRCTSRMMRRYASSLARSSRRNSELSRRGRPKAERKALHSVLRTRKKGHHQDQIFG